MGHRISIFAVVLSSLFIFHRASAAEPSDRAMVGLLSSLYDRPKKELPTFPDYQQCVAAKLKDESVPPAPVDAQMTPVSPQEAEALFQEFKNDKDIPFRYALDGCYARAYQMSEIAEQKGIKMGKVFVEGDLEAKTPKAITPQAEWQYHVAPIVPVIRDGKNEIMVMDPSLFDHPVSEKVWRSAIVRAPSSEPYCVFYTSRFTLAPNEEAKSQFDSKDQQTVQIELIRVRAILKEYDAKQSPPTKPAVQKGVDHA